MEAEIRQKARQILDDQMVDAMKAAALMVVGRKLDEIRLLLGAAGFNLTDARTAGVVQSANAHALASTLDGARTNRSNSPIPAVENPCCMCGRESVRKTKRNKFNPTGSWYCAAHAKLAAESDFEDRMDTALLGANTLAGAPIVAPKPVLVQTHPARIVSQEPPPDAVIVPAVETPVEAAGSDTLADAMAKAMGVA